MNKVRLLISDNYLFVLSGHKGDFKLIAQQPLEQLDKITMISSNSSLVAISFNYDSDDEGEEKPDNGKLNPTEIYEFLFDTIRRTELIYYLINNTKKSLRQPTFVIDKGWNINKNQ